MLILCIGPMLRYKIEAFFWWWRGRWTLPLWAHQPLWKKKELLKYTKFPNILISERHTAHDFNMKNLIINDKFEIQHCKPHKSTLGVSLLLFIGFFFFVYLILYTFYFYTFFLRTSNSYVLSNSHRKIRPPLTTKKTDPYPLIRVLWRVLVTLFRTRHSSAFSLFPYYYVHVIIGAP